MKKINRSINRATHYGAKRGGENMEVIRSKRSQRGGLADLLFKSKSRDIKSMDEMDNVECYALEIL